VAVWTSLPSSTAELSESVTQPTMLLEQDSSHPLASVLHTVVAALGITGTA
jgi:hypothetical protein